MKKLRHDDGMTLLEVLVAIAIFGMMLSGLTGLLVQQQKMGKQMQQLLEARLKATQLIETLKTLPFDQLDEASPMLVRLREEHAQIDIKNMADAPDVKQILVSISWIAQGGREYRYRLETLRSRDGISSAKGGAL
ncbi:hypothetical protein U14_04854 [Candidatus Moduliflexus flocculans]|uniref:Type II secretion system protein n=1 Tax=Candidatus Moduliflexus flocculans TaxID=1499966 RepID=A0A0S6W555_9BACT|nr:hypothetical protein U14_04854 [Candidatus Moduliflexus flocculans]